MSFARLTGSNLDRLGEYQRLDDGLRFNSTFSPSLISFFTRSGVVIVDPYDFVIGLRRA